MRINIMSIFHLVPAVLFLPFGQYAGDTPIPRQDDGYIGPFAFNFDFHYFGTIFNTFYVRTIN